MGVLFDLFDPDGRLDLPDGGHTDSLMLELTNADSDFSEDLPPTKSNKIDSIRRKYKPELNRKVYKTSDRSAVDGKAPRK